MANTSKINGLVPVRYQGGGLYTGAANIYEIVVGDGTATMIGDLVKADSGTATDVYPTCVRHGTTGEVTSGLALGVIVGFVVVASGLDAAVPTLDVPLHRRASTKRFALVADDPRLVFEIQDGATTATPISSIGLNTGFMATAGSTVTGASGMTTGTTSATTTSSLPLKIIGIVNRPDNESGVASQKLLVMINQHYYMGGQTAV